MTEKQNKTEQIIFYLTKDEAKYFSYHCSRLNISKSAKIRNMLAKRGIIPSIEVKKERIRRDLSRKATFYTPPQRVLGLISFIANEYNESVRDICSTKRNEPLPECRHLIRLVLREKTSMSLKKIGKELNMADHTTVLSGLRRIRNLIDVDPKVKNVYTKTMKNYEKICNL
jgi:chromosomal replication initiation ATPase DnaA